MDSDEEVFVAMWLQELKEAGYVKSWDKVIEAIPMTDGLKQGYIKRVQLKTKPKETLKHVTILRPSEYTPDFTVEFTTKGAAKLLYYIHAEDRLKDPAAATFYTTNQYVLLEVKPTFDQNNMERLFKLNQKFLWQTDKIFVNLVEPVALFKKTFIPLAAAPYFKYKVVTKKLIAKGKKKGDWKFDFVPKTLNEFIYV